MDAANELEEKINQSILYDLLIYSEWKQEPELPVIPHPSEGLSWYIKNAVQYFREQNLLEDTIGGVINWQHPWRLAIGHNGKVAAIIQDTCLEIKTSRDDYLTVVGKAALPKDPFPQWRRWDWSPDCTMLAIAFTNGTISVYDLLGSNLFNIQTPSVQSDSILDKNRAFAACFFLQARVIPHKWSSELVVVDYSGTLRSYFVSATEGFQESHTFSLARNHRYGVTAVARHPKSHLLFVAGPVGTNINPTEQEQGQMPGVTAWVILNDSPFYRVAHSDVKPMPFTDGIWSRVFKLTGRRLQSVIFRIKVSPSGRLMVALHSCGGISIWHLPSLRLFRFWPLRDQPNFDASNPLIEIPQSNPIPADPPPTDLYPVDVDWWSDQALVLARKSGAVSVCDAAGLRNMLGDSPEFLAGVPQIQTVCLERGFMGLECETELAGKNDNEFSDSQATDGGDLSVEEKEPSLIYRVLGTLVYVITDMERFRPKRKRTRFFRRTYRLLALRSTTPEELYNRKLDNEEYTNALSLAQQYGLDCDMVFQRQWRNSSVSIQTIHDYLGKVSKRSWVFKECVERVPDTLSAAKELLNFGLQVTDKDQLLFLGSTEKIEEFGSLNAEQLELLRYRHSLLLYRDRLSTYEKILGGARLAEDGFDHVFYDKFRKSSALDACVRFARDCSWQAIEIMLTYHGKDTLDHWLPILDNFPETYNPSNYKILLPECSSEGALFPWPEAELREADWCETHPFIDMDNSGIGKGDGSAELYDRDPSLSAYRMPASKLTSEIASQWYQDRIRTIERCSRMVDHALSLLRLGRERNIKDLELLEHHLLTLDALVYEVLMEDMSLANVEKASPLECCNFLMSKTSENTFVSDFRHILLPFVTRCEKHCEGQRRMLLESYLVGLSSKSLTLPLKFFEAAREQGVEWLYATSNEVLSLALNCLYAYPSCDQLEIAQNIVDTLPDTSSHDTETNKLRKQIKALETELKASHILNQYKTPRPLNTIQALRNDPAGAVSLMVDLCRKVSDGIPVDALLNDVLELQRTVFPCVPRDKCFDVFAESLLASGRLQCIKRASSVLQCSLNQVAEVEFDKVPYERSRELILSAAKEYVDSAPSLVCREVSLAKACLHLIPDDPEVQKEINFVSSLESLHKFGLSLLPLQVRLHSDRLRLVVSSVKQKPGSHRSLDQILHLARSLNVCDGDERALECQVLILVAEAAFQAQDYRYCAEMCVRLIAGSHATGWEVAASLGRCNEYSDIATRTKLLSFALAYCPANMIQDLLLTQKRLEEESLKYKIASLVTITNSESQLDYVTSAHDNDEASDRQDSSSFLSSLGRMGEKTVTQTTNAVIQRVGDRQFWKKALRIGWQDNRGDSHANLSEKPFVRPKCHSFYQSVLPDSGESVLSPLYNRLMAQPPPANLQMCLALQRITLLEAGHQEDLYNVLARCAQEILPEDNSLGFACLLQMPVTIVAETFSACPTTGISLALARYFAAIKLFDETFRQDYISPRDVFCYDPQELVAGVQQIKGCSSPWLNLLLESDSKLTDLTEGEELLRLGSGVNLERFTQDANYRHDSILGLAMNENDHFLKIALKLGDRHGVSRGELISTHVSTLLRSDLTASEISTCLSDPFLKDLMNESADAVVQRLRDEVWPCLDGVQHHNIQTFFTLLNDLRPDISFGPLTLKDHIKLLRKVRSVSKDIDYKKLIKGPDYITDALYGSLTSETVVSVWKLVKSLPPVLGCCLSASELNRVCAEKIIEDDKYLSLKTVSAVHTLLRRMVPEDVLSMVSSFCYPPGKSALRSIERCLQIIDICEDFSQEASENDESWKECFNILCRWRDHIRILQPLIAIQPNEELYWHFYETQGEPTAVSHALHNALHSDVSFEVLFKLISTISGQYHVTLSGLLHEELLQYRSEENHQALSEVLTRLEQAEEAGIYVVESCLSALKELAASNDLDPNVRVRVIALIQRFTMVDHEGDSDFSWHQTQAIIVAAWGSDILSSFTSLRKELEEKRSEFYLQLIKMSSTFAHCKALRRLVQQWPQFRITPNDEDPVVYLITPCLQCDNGKWSEEKADFLEELFVQEKMDEKSVKEQVQNLRGGPVDVQLLILVTLLCKQRTLHLLAVSLIQHQLKEDLQDRNVYLILKRQLCSLLVTTPYYSHLVSVLLYSPKLHDDRPAAISTLVNHLRARGCFAEAGSLLLAKSPPVPKSLRTFSGALAVISAVKSENSGRSTPSSFIGMPATRRSGVGDSTS